jgi:hypothetical protein
MSDTSPFDPLHVVLRPAPGDPPAEPSAALLRLGSVQALSGARGGWLLTLQQPLRRAADLPRLLAGHGLQALPLLHDEAGQPRYPTGELVVRFARPVDDAALARLAGSCGLRMLRRSSFTQNQAVFAPQQATGSDVLALLARVAAEPGVAAAWLDAESEYRRAE